MCIGVKMLDSTVNDYDNTEAFNVAVEENTQLDSRYYQHWAKTLINSLQKGIEKYDIDSEDKSLVRYLKIRILDPDGKLMRFSETNEDIESAYTLVDEPIAFNDDGAVTVDFKSPTRVANLDSNKVLTIDSDFPEYYKIISVMKEYQRVKDLHLDVACFSGDCEDLREELINRAKEYASAELGLYGDINDYIDNIDDNELYTISFNDHRTTPQNVALLAYARKACLENHRMPLDELYMTGGMNSESGMMRNINSLLRMKTEDITGELDIELYNAYENLLDREMGNDFKM